ncbi:MAG: dinitrogenase iron-molybdenum cofactor biosynthesis protein [Chloroflexi bacterium]|nr:dinitrogenase iron-molybdenum cofactor biosynthesis protein [Chloroflexota bacterium]
MKIVITTVAPSIESQVDPRFGRGAYLLVVDPNTLEWQAHPNPGVHAPGGAGIAAAQFVLEQKGNAIISGDFGPNAFDALSAAKMPIYRLGTSRTAREVVARFQAGQLERVDAATRGEGHPKSGT